MKVDIVVLNYNGEKLLPEFLPSIVEAKENSKNEVSIYVIDNESADSSLDILEGFGNSINVIKHKNRFLCSFNDVVTNLKSDIVILLNNDIKVDKNFIEPLIEVFSSKKDAFLVAPKVLDIEGNPTGAFTKAKIKFGIFMATDRFKNWQTHLDEFNYTFSCGFGAFDRKKFAELGGYDDLYLPGIIEDADLSFMAYKRGYKCYYQPKSIVYHLGQSSFKERFGEKGILKLAYRNTFLFMWKNITDPWITTSHFFLLPLRLCYSLLFGPKELIFGFFDSLKKLDEIKRSLFNSFVSDREIFNIFKDG